MSGSRSRTHDEIDARARRAAGGFVSAGIGAGDAVAILMRNDFVFFEAARAATFAGTYTVPINWHASTEEAVYILRDCQAKALVAHADLLIEPLASNLSHNMLLLVVDTPSEVRDAFGLHEAAPVSRFGERWDDWIAQHEAVAQPVAESLRPVIYTSGSTGRPKGVQRAGRPGSKGSAKALAVYGFDKAGPIKALINGPLYHSVPNAYGRLAVDAGVDIVLQARFDPEDLLALIDQHRVTHMHIVPAMFVRLLALPQDVRRRHDLSSLRHVVHGAAPCPQEVKAAMIDWWGPVIHEYYGSTETGLLTFHNSEEAASRPGTVGRALPGVVLSILDKVGARLPTGAVGEIYAGSATLHDFTYVNQDQKRAEIGRGKLVTAGDVGWMDADGYLYLCGRKRDVILSNGAEIFPVQVEAMLLNVSGVQDCAVFGLPDETHGELVCVCVAPVEKAQLNPATLFQCAEAAIGRPGTPIRIEIVAALPREDSGKIFKQTLREFFLSRAR